MNTGVIIVEGVLILLVLVLGVSFSYEKGAFLIAGFNTMSKEEKEKFDKPALCKFMGKVMYAISFCLLLWVLSEAAGISWLFYLGCVLQVIVTIFALIYANTHNRFKK